MRRAPRLLLPLLVATTALLTGFALAAGPAQAAQPATWNFNQPGVPAAQPLGNYGRGVLVALVDTWVDATDTEFGGRVVDEASCIRGDGTCVDHTYTRDACVHGTHVAGTIASADYGVAPAAQILAVQALTYDSSSGSCTGSTADVAAGIDLAVAKGARVINLSIGDALPLLEQSSAITSAVQHAAASGVVVVIAAGNSGLPFSDSYGTNAIVVAATGPDGQLAGYSNSSNFVSMAAPGGDSGGANCSDADCVLSTFPYNQVGLLQGTSMAAPHVSGTAALLLSQNPGRSRADVINTIESTARPLAGAGRGVLDAHAALMVESGAHPPVTTPTTGTTPASGVPATSAPTTASAPVAPAPAGTPGYGTPGYGTTPAPALLGAQNSTATTSGTVPTPSAPVPSTAVSSPPTTRLSIVLPTTPPSTSATVPPTRPVALGPTGHGSDFLGRHAGVLIAACLLVVVDLLALLWLRGRGPRSTGSGG